MLIMLVLGDFLLSRNESDPLSRDFFLQMLVARLENVISSKHASEFKKILRKNAISEQEVCKKYEVDRIEELTGDCVLFEHRIFFRSSNERWEHVFFQKTI